MKQRRLTIPAPFLTSRELLKAVTPYYLQPSGGDYQPSVPALLSFDTEGFMEEFLSLAAGERNIPTLLPWRDWSEAPAGVVKLNATQPWTTTLQRQDPPLRRLLPGQSEQFDWEDSPVNSKSWLRKLYLPQHERFTLVAVDLICQRPEQPSLDRARVMEAGLVVRRLAVPQCGTSQSHGQSQPQPSASWEDWIAIDERQGVWMEFLDSAMMPNQSGLGSSPTAIDPAKIPLSAFGDQQEVIKQLLKTARGHSADESKNGSNGEAPEPTTSLTSDTLLLVPTTIGEGGKHCSFYGYLPVFSGARQMTVEPVNGEDLNTLQQNAEKVLNCLFTDSAGLIPTRAAVSTMLEQTILPQPPKKRPLDIFSENGLLECDQRTFQNLRIAVDLLLRDALHKFCTYAAGHSADTIISSSGDYVSGEELWTASKANKYDLAAVSRLQIQETSLQEDVLEMCTQLPMLLQANTLDSLVRARLFEFVGLVLGQADQGYTWPSPTSETSPFLVLSHSMVELLLGLGLQRLKLAYSKLLDEVVVGEEPYPPSNPSSSFATCLSQVEGILARDDEGTQSLFFSWKDPTTPIRQQFQLIAQRPLRLAHDAAVRLAAAGQNFDRQLASAGYATRVVLNEIAKQKQEELTNAFGASDTSVIQALNAPVTWPISDLNFLEQPLLSLLVFPGIDSSTHGKLTKDLTNKVKAYYQLDSNLPLVQQEAAAARQHQPLRFDDEHLYAVWCWVRVAGRHPCEKEQLFWSGRSEPFSIAEPLDLLGTRPTSIRMPNIPHLVRDLGRMAKAKSNPFAAVISPDGSGIDVSGAAKDFSKVKRDMGLGFVCTYGIPVFTICALILFSIIFSILVIIPGFMWMLFLKVCFPAPKQS